MKLWIGVLGVMVTLSAARSLAAPAAQAVKDVEGKTVATIVICNDCQSPGGAKCYAGVEEGWLDGKPCGKCMLARNGSTPLSYAYDIHITGKLVDAAGQPVKDRFVKMFLPNGWSVRSRTTDDGAFRLMLGATAGRKSKRPATTDLGTRVDSVAKQSPKGSDFFALFFLPDGYTPCAAEDAKPAAHKAAPKKAL